MTTNKYTKIFIIFLITLFIFIYIEFNTEYKLINHIPKMIKSNIGTLYIGTHNYEHKDIFITMNEFKKFNDKFYMLFADKSWNYLLEPFRPKNIEFLYVKEKTVEKISSKLLLGHNVIMFLYAESDSTGAYYILKNTKTRLVILKIKKIINNNKDIESTYNHYNSSITNIFWNNFMSKFTLELKKINYNLLKNSSSTTCKSFIKQLKNKMYN